MSIELEKNVEPGVKLGKNAASILFEFKVRNEPVGVVFDLRLIHDAGFQPVAVLTGRNHGY